MKSIIDNIKVVNRSILSQSVVNSQVFDIMQSHNSVLGNPFYLDKCSRAEKIAKFRVHLWAKIQQKDPAVLKELSTIKKTALTGTKVYLMCCCKPAACHGDVVKSCIEWALSKS